MTCPICGEKTRVIDSRPDCESVFRKRECVECGYRFATIEYEIEADKKHKAQSSSLSNSTIFNNASTQRMISLCEECLKILKGYTNK